MQNPTKAEAERLLGISHKLLQNRDLNGSREFALLAQETDPLLDGSDQILAVIDVLLAADKRINNNNLDWYSILQIERRSDDLDLIKKQYRRLALLLHPDKNGLPYADHAFKLVADAWAVLSDPIKKAHYDKVFSFFSRVDLSVPSWVQQQDKYPPVRRTGSGPGPTVPGPRPSANVRNATTAAAVAREEVAADENLRRRNVNVNFWTACPYCYRLYEYPRVYEGCCLRCPNCDRSFHGVEVSTMPQIVPGQEAYYCCWGFFPMGFVVGNFGSAEKDGAPVPEPEIAPVPEPDLDSVPNLAPVPVGPVHTQPISSLPNWMPVPAENGGNATPVVAPTPVIAPASARLTRAGAAVGASNGVAVGSGSGPKRRGRPRKYTS